LLLRIVEILGCVAFALLWGTVLWLICSNAPLRPRRISESIIFTSTGQSIQYMGTVEFCAGVQVQGEKDLEGDMGAQGDDDEQPIRSWPL
jgi:hypothetical protein